MERLTPWFAVAGVAAVLVLMGTHMFAEPTTTPVAVQDAKAPKGSGSDIKVNVTVNAVNALVTREVDVPASSLTHRVSVADARAAWLCAP